MSKLDIKFLLNGWSTYGRDLNEFKEVIKELDDSTKYFICNTNELTVLHMNKETDNDIYVCQTCFEKEDPYFEGRMTKQGIKNRIGLMAQPFIDQMFEAGFFLTHNSKKNFFMSYKSLGTFMQRLNVGGSSMLEPSLRRDMFLQEVLRYKNKRVMLCTREFNGVNKVFAVFSDKYQPVSQQIVVDTLDYLVSNTEMGNVDIKSWQVSHDLTEVDVSFPDMAADFQNLYNLPDAMVPGLKIQTSDIGTSGFCIYETWEHKGHKTYRLKKNHKHMGQLELDTITENIYPDYTKLPERLCDLMTMDIFSSLDRKSTNQKKMQQMISSIFKEIGLVKKLGAPFGKKLRSLILDEWDYSQDYTAYDFVMYLLDIPQRACGTSKANRKKLEEVVAEVPYCHFESTGVVKAEDEEVENIVLI